MTNIPIMAFAGYSGSGKTTLLEKLIREIKSRGVRLAIIKHDGHQFDIDHEGKDSWRFTHAGADITVVTSADKTACVSLGECPLSNLLSGIHDVDLVLIEGFKNEKLPQIGVARRENGKGFTAPLEHFLAIITDMDVESPVPCFGYEDIPAIADFILEKTIMEKAKDFTHFNDEGRAKMVNVGEKPESRRTAIAAARVLVNRTTFDLIRSGGMKKGDVLTVAQIAGVMGAKRTPDIIPMCHPILLDGIDLSLRLDASRCSVEIEATVSCDGRTGVEMEALTAASTAALTVYDMCKAVQKDMVISDIRLLRKSGGVHGDFERKEE